MTCVAFAATLSIANVSNAQSDPDRYKVSSNLGLNFDVPESPAFTVLNLNPQEISRAATPRDFATQLINGLDRNGNFQSGLAIELNPWGIADRNNLFGKKPVAVSTHDKRGYADGDWTPFNWGGKLQLMRNLVYRTSLSFATAKAGDGDDGALRIAAGVRATPWDPGDSRLIVSSCLVRRLTHFSDTIDAMTSDNGNYQKMLSSAVDDLEGKVAPNRAAARELHQQLEDLNLKQDDREELLETANEVAKILKIDLDQRDSRTALQEIEALETNYSEANVNVVKTRLRDTFATLEAYYLAKTEITKEEQAPDKGGEKNNKVEADAEGSDAKRVSTLKAILTSLSPKEARDVKSADATTMTATKTADAMVLACKKEEEGLWNGSSWDISFAPSWISANGSTDNLRWNGGAIWTSLSLGGDSFDIFGGDFALLDPSRVIGEESNQGEEHYSQLILHGRYRFEERMMMGMSMDEMSGAMIQGVATDNMTVEQDTWLVGARMRFFLPTNFLPTEVGFSLEGSVSNTDVSGNARMAGDDTFYRFAVIPTIRITENTWVDVSFGTETGNKNGNDAFLLSNIKYGFGQEAFPSLNSSDDERLGDSGSSDQP